MLIEVVGVDGSGKTTLIQGLRRQINESGVAFAYERSFQSRGLRLLEAAASTQARKRPGALYDKAAVELVRTVELVEWSLQLRPFVSTGFQIVFCDSYITEQTARLIAQNALNPAMQQLLRIATKPDLVFQLEIPPELAVARMRERAKGDAILLFEDPLKEVSALARNLSDASDKSADNIVHFDATGSKDSLLVRAFELIQPMLGSSNGR